MHRVIGIQLLSVPRPPFFLSVYLPSRSGCTDDFKEALDYIDAVINTYGFDNDIVILGDMNADIGNSAEPITSPSEQGRILSAYLARWNYLSVHLCLPLRGHAHTSVSDAHNTKSTIDHILAPNTLLNNFKSAQLLDEDPVNMSDHLPVLVTLRVALSMDPITQVSQRTHTSRKPYRPNWAKLSKDFDTTTLEARLSSLPKLALPADGYASQETIDTYVNNLTSILLEVAKENIPGKRYYRHLTPNWSEEMKDAQKQSKAAYKTWKAAGSPTEASNPFHYSYKLARGKFRANLRHHRKELHEIFLITLMPTILIQRKCFAEIRHFHGKPQSVTKTLRVNNVNHEGNDILVAWASYYLQSLLSPADVSP